MSSVNVPAIDKPGRLVVQSRFPFRQEALMSKFLSPKALAQAIGVSESSLKRWADEGQLAVTRTLGGHRRVELSEAIRFIRDKGLPVVDPTPLGMSDLRHAADITDVNALILHALMEGHGEDVRNAVISMYLAGRGVADICDGPLTQAMHHIGELWKHDASGIAIEHRAVDVCLQALNQLRSLLPAPAPSAPVALGCAPADDSYLLPSLMAATVLSAQGWRSINLGPDLPLHLLADAATHSKAQLIWVSVSVEHAAAASRDKLTQMGDHIATHGAQLIVGGQGWTHRPQLGVHGHFGQSMTELSLFAKGLCQGVKNIAIGDL